MERSLEDVCKAAEARRLPRWEELPDLELYMDQVLALTERYLGAGQITASMVNNYVKLGVVPPPVKKRYSRAHLARLLEVCALKASLPIESIGRLPREPEEAAFYNRFCEAYEEAFRSAAAAARQAAALPSVYAAALRSGAEQVVARALSEDKSE